MTSKELLKNFSENARYLCKQKGKSIGELEKEIGVSKGYLSRIVNSEKAISLANLYKISQILETTIDDLISKDMCLEWKIQELEKELDSLKKQRGDR